MTTRLLLTTLALGSSGCTALVLGNGDERTEVRSLPEITELRLRGPFTVDVRAAPASAATITCDSNLLPFILTDWDGTRLTLRVAGNRTLEPRAPCRVAIDLRDPPVAIEVTGAGDVDVDTDLSVLTSVGVSGAGSLVLAPDRGLCDLDADLSGTGDLDFGTTDGDCDVVVGLSGASTVTAAGSAASLDARVSGSGTLALADLVVERADVDLSGTGGGEVHVTSSLRARVSGAGNLVVHGAPPDRDVQTTGTGAVDYR
jgi:hypothetical protein